MEYRTIIEIIAEADDKNDAIDIAGEFLRGDLESGVEMKCHSRPLKPKPFTLFRTTVFIVLVSSLLGIASLGYFKDSNARLPRFKSTSAFQPPLKTYNTIEFKKNWEERENKKVFEYIKK